MIEKPLHALTDAELAGLKRDAEAREVAARNLACECRLHQLMRNHVRRGAIENRIASLRRQLDRIKAGTE